MFKGHSLSILSVLLLCGSPCRHFQAVVKGSVGNSVNEVILQPYIRVLKKYLFYLDCLITLLGWSLWGKIWGG